MVDIRGPEAKVVRGEMLSGAEAGDGLQLADGRSIRLTPEYRYLGVIQQPRDTGRRDQELCALRGQSSWAQARSLLTSCSLPRCLQQAWIAGRILPAAYATLANSIAVSARATAPLEGFFERATRVLAKSWQFGHVLTKPGLIALSGLTAPSHAVLIARVRLVCQFLRQAPEPVWDIFDACWNRSTPSAELLVGACHCLRPAIAQLCTAGPTTLALVRSSRRAFEKACKHLSRFGSLYSAFWDLWQDVVQARGKRVLGQQAEHRCPLCSVLLPSKHALAAHCHRKHTIVNSLTRYTSGTVCLWCHTEHFSTDRLKYHLRTTRECVRGLRVTVGETYTYGTGSKRTGAGRHRGLPPQRLPGPRNATPLQRQASLSGHTPTREELQDELWRVAGVTDEYSWPSAFTPDSTSAATATADPGASAHHLQPLAGLTSPATVLSAISYAGLVWRRFADSSWTGTAQLPSPHWAGLSKIPVCYGLPCGWHRFWNLWAAANSGTDPWGFGNRRAQGLLRACQASSQSGLSHGTLPLTLEDLLAATVTFRLICECVCRSGLVWLPGVPSTAGLQLFRKLLPAARFHFVRSAVGNIFVAAHPSLPLAAFADTLLSAEHSDFFHFSSLGAFLQPSMVYHTRSPDSGF